jgi:serine/threonine-protein kinase
MDFHARDQKTGQDVALRVLAPRFPASNAEMQQFLNAFRVVLPLRHPHVVSVYNAGRNPPYCWLAMEEVPGQTLADVIEQLDPPGKYAWQHALRLGIDLCRALNYVYHHRLSHRNITPASIVLRASNKAACLNNLLLAQAVQGSTLDLATREAIFQAELPYYSPERMRGLGEADILSDIYSLGACMYARCTGRPPYQGPSVAETIEQIHGAPLPSLRQLQPAIPRAFEAVVAKMLARTREDRYRTPAWVLASLEFIAASEGVEV